jgi:protein-tyrosine phosphatase
MQNLIKIPLGLKGKIYRSPMPFGYFDEGNTTFEEFKEAGIDTAVVLVPKDELLHRSGLDLLAFYKENNIDVIHLPMADYDVPENNQDLEDAINETIKQAEDGKSLAVHCFAGRGRTGMFIALLSRRTLKLGGAEAITWTRKFFSAIETGSQRRIVDTNNYKEE